MSPLPSHGLRALVLVSLCLPLAQGHAQAIPDYGLLGFKMVHSAEDPFRYYIDGRMVGQLSAAQVQPQVQAAYATWQAVSCAYPAFESLGLSTNNPQIVDVRDTQDSFNVTAVWITSNADPYYAYALGGGTAAAASVPLSYGGTLYQCDIYLNAVDYQFAFQTPTPAGFLDLQTLILHEVGHCLGLGHSDEWDDVMWPSAGVGAQRRALTQRDVDVLCGLYPQTGAVGSPCTNDASCGNAGLECIQPSLPDGGTGPSFCSKGCVQNVPGECALPFVCKPSTLISGHTAACLPSRGDFVTQVGAPCAQHNQCGSAVGLCQQEGVLPSGGPAWPGGYCMQACGAGNTPCPSGSECVNLAGSDLCMKTCRLGSGDCRFGYTCAHATDAINLCVTSCVNDQDCGDPNQFLCRQCDGTCLAKQRPTGQVGDLCEQSSQCGPEQFCLTFQGAGSVGVCSKTCGTACSACPTGASCHPLGDGNHYCLKDCTQGTGSCPFGYQCGLLPTGRGCIPGCQTNADCPVGNVCHNNECRGESDGGACVLCPTDSGVTGPPPPRPDAGQGGGNEGGCGCSSAATSGLFWAGLPLLLLFAQRRRKAP